MYAAANTTEVKKIMAHNVKKSNYMREAVALCTLLL
jgi:hypothetical protein